jgi:hypothetical protein
VFKCVYAYTSIVAASAWPDLPIPCFPAHGLIS